jgi:peptide/nickel transport system ATP-binding protein
MNPETTADVPLLEIRNLQVSYGTKQQRVPALRGITFTVGRGEKVAVVGESGSGKSTTAHAVIHLLPPGGRVDAGSIRLGGRELTTLSDRQMRAIRGAQVGLIPQDPMSSLNPLSRIGTQLKEALSAHGRLPDTDTDDHVVALLQAAGLTDAARVAFQYPHQLSGGMRQRVLIAIALACRPGLVIADEPTSALDVTVQRRILDHIDALSQENGASLLLITHDLGVAADRADRIIVMNHGEVVEQGTTDEVLGSPRDAYTRKLLAAAPSLSTAVLATPPPAPDEPLVSVSGLRKTFPVPGPDRALVAVDDVSFDIAPGETVAIVGESGSGKSTIARLLLKLEQADAGTIVLDGTDISTVRGGRMRPHRRSMQMVYQNPFGSLSPRLTIGELIGEPLRIHKLAGRAESRRIAADLLEQVSLDPALARRRPRELSGGQRQRVAIARALALAPRLIVCDEAVSALDVSVQAQILDLLAQIQRDRAVAYLFISHDLAVVRQIAHRVLVMKSGRIVEQGATAALFAAPQADYTRELLGAIPGQSHGFVTTG